MQPAIAIAVALSCTGLALASHNAVDTRGHTTLEQVVAGVDADGNPATAYQTLRAVEVDGSYLVRDRGEEDDRRIPSARSGRSKRRRSLAYFGQMTDFQFADEESPARVEFVDPQANSAWRPAEAFIPFATDASVRQMNRFAPASPVPQDDGTGNAMDFVLITGDQADNSQRNETTWVRDVLEGGRTINFNSGATDPAFYATPGFDSSPSCAAFLASKGGSAAAAVAEAARYTGVQDASDYPPTGSPDAYYDPDDPQGYWAEQGWPKYPNLLDQAQALTLTPEGLAVPFYLTNGNHDVLAQGNEDANQGFERIATGCSKVLASSAGSDADSYEDFLTNPSLTMLVPPDPQRQFVSKPQLKEIYGETAANDDDHGFAYVDERELEASNGSASYYAWNPPQTPGIRFISIDTNSEGGVVGPFGPQPTGSSDGNLDDPQFKWLQAELDAAQAGGKLIVVFGHHPIRSIDAAIPDEAAAQCSGDDPHGHDVNPGCDLDPRISEPLHLGDPEEAEALGSSAKTVSELFAEYPNLIAYVPGHTHENRVIPYPKGDDGVFWEINTSAVIDHPQQSRLVEVFDNRDGTLSIFGTILDHASPGTPPVPGSDAIGFSALDLASIGRELAYNDPQHGHAATTEEGDPPPPTGFAEDQNVELLVADPRIARGGKRLRCGGKKATIVGTTGADRLEGTDGDDVIVTGPGRDRIRAGGGRDRVCAGPGKDRVAGGGKGDVLRGMKGDDRVSGQGGGDRLSGGRGRDRVSGGGGRDRCGAERRAGRGSTRGCEQVTGRRGR